jgi:prepilin-type N-terminal cleavage/methylation domain-containing protein
MRKAFTIIELIFVIVIIAILSSVAITRIKPNNQLKIATQQIIRHINYTKHLALTDDVFTPVPIDYDNNYGASNLNDKIKGSKFWWKKNWQIIFHKYNKFLIYTIYSDDSSDKDSNSQFDAVPSAGEVVYDPHKRIRMTGKSKIKDYNKKMNIEKTYGITNIKFSGGCTKGKRLVFDNFGRPYNGYNKDSMTTNPYESFYQIRTRCLITITHIVEGKSFICIEPISGYVREVASKNSCN